MRRDAGTPNTAEPVVLHPSPELPFDYRIIAGTRLFLATAGLVVVWLVPSEPSRWVEVTYATLVLHVAYGVAVYVAQVTLGRTAATIRDWGHWIDVGWYTLLITLSLGTNSIFFFGYFFPILVASMRWGFVSGIRVTVLSTLLFTTLGYMAAPAPPEFEHQRFLIRPAYLVGLGYVMASWGGYELRLRTRLQFLKDAATVVKPHAGIERTIEVLMRQIMRLYGADGCAMITRDPDAAYHELYRVRREEGEGVVSADKVPVDLAARVLRLPEQCAVAFVKPDRVRTWPVAVLSGREGAPSPGRPPVETEACRALANILETGSFLGAPFGVPDRFSGWLVLAYEGKRAFDESEASFLVQVAENAFLVLDKIRLEDQLASTAAREERERIARDIHDGVIQPYVGLRIGLAGLRQKLLAQDRDVSEVDRLIEMANLAIEDLRGHVSALRFGGDSPEGLVPALSRFATRYSAVTGIVVNIIVDGDVQVRNRLAGEVFQMVVEGLSNVRRHSSAKSATVHLGCPQGQLLVRIEDVPEEPTAFTPFTPRSISERAAALGGRVRVQAREGGGSAVIVEIPLQG